MMGTANGLTPLIPEGETACVWMEAGVISYKLCDFDGGCEACPFDRAMRGQAGPEASLYEVSGVKMHTDLFYHPKHVWVRIKERGEVVLGLDDFAQRLLGSVTRLVLPHPGLRIEASPPRVFARGALFSLIAPIHGVITHVNKGLVCTPSLIHASPYTAGWLVRATPTRLKGDLERLMYGHEARRWLQKEYKRLSDWLSMAIHRDEPLPGAMLQDGGVPSLEALELLDSRKLKEAVRLFLVG